MTTLLSVIQRRALRFPNREALLFLANGKDETEKMTVGELNLKAQSIATYLQQKKQIGQRVLLFYPPGLDFISAFLGCLYAGVIAVPIPCPKENEFEKTRDSLMAIAKDADIAGIFTTQCYLKNLKKYFKTKSLDKDIFIVDTATLNDQKYKSIQIKKTTIAYLQYTSGSTSAPKAAVITHENLIYSLKNTVKTWRYTNKSITLNWAPHTHIYGLICGILVPLYHGTLAILMPPSEFIRQPINWLKAISKYKATHGGCPNFGYEICVRDINDAELSVIDLSSWKVAVNGGESVQYNTLLKFVKKFGSVGFQLNQFCTAYGMSEVTGAISSNQYGKDPVFFNDHLSELKDQKLMSSGRLLPDLFVQVVDTEQLKPVKEGEVGEIWLAGKQIVSKYWQRPEESKAVFGARLSSSDLSYFRTGDLGFIRQGEICLTGRLKEVIVQYGKKYYPLDLETVVTNELNRLSLQSACASFSFPVQDGNEKVVFIQEVKPEINRDVQDKIIKIIRDIILKSFGIELHAIVLTSLHSIPKTSSGKLQRKACQKLFLENTLNIVRKEIKFYDEPAKLTSEIRNPKLSETYFIELVASVLKINPLEIDIKAPVSQYGFDSIHIIRLATLLNETYHLSVTPAMLFGYKTLLDCYNDLLKKTPESISKSAKNVQINDRDIAIIGMSCIFPGSSNVNEFWNNLILGKDVITEVPSDRWDWKKENIKTRWGGFINGIMHFDAGFFNISPREAELIDPQQRLFLQTVWKAIEDAGYSTKALSHIKTGVFAGIFSQDYAELLQKNEIYDAYITTGLPHSMLVNRVSYLLNLQGPSEAIDTACSSSLVAIHNAINAIYNGDCEIAIAGGVNALLTPTLSIAAANAGMLSKDGRCKTFDKDANGYVRSEGVAAILLKPLKKALIDKDSIYGIIKGSAVNHGGNANSLTAPNPSSQSDLIVSAYKQAHIPIESVDCIETHGTGTPLGDPIEINGLKKAFSILSEDKLLPTHSCALGALKTHIGHLESAAGIAGIIKILLAMKHEKLPGNIHFKELNPYINLSDSPFYILQETKPWLRDTHAHPRRAGVSSFGFGGTNSHIILEEGPYFAVEESDESAYLITLSAKTLSALEKKVYDLDTWLEDNEENNSIAELSYTLNVGRDHFIKRVALMVDSIQGLKKNLKKILEIKLFDNSTILKNSINFLQNKNSEKWVDTARAYLNGQEIDWDKLYVSKLRRLHLPTYPFEEKYYRFAENQSIAKRLHPLLDQNISTFTTQAFVKAFRADEYYLIGHQVNENDIVPGTIYLEMAIAAIHLALSDYSFSGFKNITWIKPLNLKNQSSVKISLYYESNHIKFVVCNKDEETEQYIKGEILLSRSSSLITQTLGETKSYITSLKDKLAKSMSPQEFYNQLAQLGLQYGENFKTINEISYDDNHALTLIQLSETLSNQNNLYLNPCLLDGILHSAFVLIKDDDSLYLPISIGDIEVYASLPATCFSYVNKISHSESEAVFHIQVMDDVGNQLINIKNFVVHKAIKPERKIYFYHPIWSQSKITLSDHASFRDPIVVWDDTGKLIKSLREEHSNQQFILVQKDFQFNVISDQEIKVDTNSKEGFLRLLEYLTANNLSPKYFIIHLDPNHICYDHLLYLSQATLLNKNSLTLFCMSEESSLYIESLVAFAKTLHIENPQLICRVAVIPNVKNVLSELPQQDVEVSYNNDNIRKIRNYEEILGQPQKLNRLKKGGTYLITGGAGQLGLVFAQYLAEHYKANLILIGRSSLTDKIQLHLSTLNQYAAKVKYYQVDITQKNKLKSAWEEIKKLFGDVNGIIHAAGVTHDDFILNKQIELAQKVLGPKIQGVLNLDEITQAEQLDFFVLFSSVSSVFGNMGQSDYAYANHFLDKFAERRELLRKQNKRQGRTFSINWPLWNSGGMKMEHVTRQWLEDKYGIVSISFEEGIQVFLRILNQDYTQQIVLPGYKNKLEQALFSGLTQKMKENDTSFSSNDLTVKKEIELFFKNILSHELKLSQEKIFAQEPFENYGIDSVMIIGLNQKLEDIFGRLPKTLFFEYRTLDDLIGYFIKNHLATLSKKLSLSAQSSSSTKPLSLGEEFKMVKINKHTDSNLNDIAIIGVSGRYPQANNLDEFWNNLRSGKDCITEVPLERWNHQNYFNLKNKWGGFINDVDCFDPLFFNISPSEAEAMDPQERLFLETAWSTIEDAGYSKEKLSGKNIGVFVGAMYGHYQLFNSYANSFFSSIANRVSYYFDFHGPSLALDTMCSSSLTAIHLACKSIRDGECDAAIAGGVNLSIHVNKYLLLSHHQFLSSDGHCHSFGEGGDGYVPGEGVGAILLKPLYKAIEDSDHIYGVIKSSAINHGGKTNGYTVPNPQAQRAVIEQAYRNADVDPSLISYIEAHGTGTGLGDPIEIAGLNAVFSDKKLRSSCAMGSVKSNIGHCESAAGIAAVTKVLLQLQHKQIVPSLHSETLNQNIDWEQTPFKIQQKLTVWEEPRIAGISSFGAGGSNAHLVIEEPPIIHAMGERTLKQNYLITLSAKTEKSLLDKIAQLESWVNKKILDKTDESLLEKISYTLNTGRSHFQKRCAIVVSSLSDLSSTLGQLKSLSFLSNAFVNVSESNHPQNEGTFQKLLNQLLVNTTRENLLILAKFYVDGYTLDWELLHENENHIKISLPTYPFAREHYWITSEEKNVAYTDMKPAYLNQQSFNLQDHSFKSALIQMVSAQLKIDKAMIDASKDLSEYGMDSIQFIELTKTINDYYKLSLTPSIFYTHNHINSLSQYLSSQTFDNTIMNQSVVSREDKNNHDKQLIAIIGMEGMFPQSDNLEIFWEHLIAGDDLVTEIPFDRWRWQDFPNAKSRFGGFLNRIDLFDAGFFNISAREANLMDPQQRLFLEIAWKTIENAGYDPLAFSGNSVGVFVGSEFTEYHSLIAKQQKEFHGLVATGNSPSLIANRVSYYLNFRGPSETISTACSSSLVAIHRAVKAIQNGECSIALAGGVSLILDPDTYTIMSNLGALSIDGRCKTFDKSANGYVKGEGVGAVLLKSLDQAKLDGDHIYAVIHNSVVNHGGKAQSLTAPNVTAQTELLLKAYRNIDFEPETISYIETHGTGTELGDPAEIEGLKQAFQILLSTKSVKAFCGLGSIKTQIGHLEPASGIASLAKVLLAMQHKKIPGNLHFNELNSYIDLKDSPFYIVNKTQDWEGEKRAGISSFGFGGSYAHIVLSESAINEQTAINTKPYYLVTLSAKEQESLNQKIIELHQWLSKNLSNVNLQALAYTLNQGRTHFNKRYAFVIDSLDNLLLSLKGVIDQIKENRFNTQETKAVGPVYDEVYQTAVATIQQYPNINTILYKEKLLLISDLYCKHYPIDWKLLQGSEKIQRIASLPSYPFLKKRYWFDVEITKPNHLIVENESSAEDFTLKYLQSLFSSVLHVSPEHITYDDTYEVFGVDSVLGLEITERLERDFGTLSKTLLYERNCLKDLAAYFELNYSKKIEELKFNSGYKFNKEVVQFVPQNITRSLKELNINVDQKSEDIAIIGLSGTFPLANNINEFWENLVAGRDCVTAIPPDRWDYKDYPVSFGSEEKYYKMGGFIPDVDKFDPLFFNITPRDATLMDPQERLFLQSTWTTLEDAGYTRERLRKISNNEVGVFAGVTYNFYPLFIAEEWQKGNRIPLDIQSFSIANRVSYFLNLSGPSYVIDTACSSALAAIHLACESILRGECKMAFAGGVNLSLHPSKYHFLGSFNLLSDEGRCASFGADGNGYVPAEGVGSILLKPLSLAIRDKDRIYGLIKSSSMNHGGKTSGYTVPNPQSQASLIKTTFEKANINPRTISYIEAHGTGTSLGDPIEIRGLQEAFEFYTQDKQFCALGSVKSNVGHLEAAAGISQLAKVLLQLQNKKLVPSLHSEKLNPFIPFDKTPFYVQHKLSDWLSVNDEPRRAGISSFGAGGTNVHLIVEEYLSKDDARYSIPDENIFVISAMNEERLKAYVQSIIEYLKNEKGNNKEWFNNLCFTSQVGREEMSSRIAMIVNSCEAIINKLQHYLLMNEADQQTWINHSIQNKRQSNSETLIWINENKFEKIASEWAKGEKISWDDMAVNQFAKRIYLPTYPFAKRRCWVGSALENNSVTLPPYLDEWLYFTQWEKKDKIDNRITSEPGEWIIFGECELAHAIKNLLKDKSSIIEEVDELIFALAKNNDHLQGIIYLSRPNKKEACEDLLLILQALINVKCKNKILFNLVSRGSQVITDQEEIDIWQHYLWAMIRIFATENADYKVLLLDLDPNINLQVDATQLITEIQQYQSSEMHVAYRRGSRYSLRFVNYLQTFKPDKLQPWQAPHTVLITGGLGALGFEVARWLISLGTKYLLLTGTTKLPEKSTWGSIKDNDINEKIMNLKTLEKLGAQVKYASVDVTNKSEMTKVVHQTEQEWNNRIQGVFHLAGITTDNVPVADLDRVLLRKVLSVKVHGAIVLHELFNRSDLNCFVLFSSIAATPYFGVSGLSAYAVANEFLNSLALFRHHKQLPATSINWVAWAEKGMSFKYNHAAFLNAIGMTALNLSQGIEILKYLLDLKVTTITICKIFWDKFLQLNKETQKLDFFTHFIKKSTDSKIKIDLSKYDGKEITQLLLDVFSKTVELTINEIDLNTPFEQYGLDSISGIQFTTKLNEYFPDVVSPMDLYRYPTIRKLCDYILQHCKKENIDDQLTTDIANLTDEQVSELLEEELKGL